MTALSSLALLAILQNADVIVFGSQAPHRSGSYAAISVPSKALVYAALVFVNYLLPESAIRWQQGSHALRQLGHTLLILALPAAVLLGVSVAAPRTLLDVVYKAKLAGAAPAFATLVLAMVFLCVTVVLTVYLLGVGWRWVVLLLAAGHRGSHPADPPGPWCTTWPRPGPTSSPRRAWPWPWRWPWSASTGGRAGTGRCSTGVDGGLDGGLEERVGGRVQ